MIRRLSETAIAGLAVEAVPVVDLSAPIPEHDAAAFAQGYREGFEAGEADGARESAQRLKALECEVRLELEHRSAEVAAERERLRTMLHGLEAAQTQHHEQLREASFEIAMKALAGAFGEREGDHTLLLRMVDSLLQDFRKDAVRLEVSVADRDLLPMLADGLPIDISPMLRAGECLLVGTNGRVASSIEHRLGVIQQAMLRALAGASADA